MLQKERLTTAEQARVLAREVEIYADKEKEWARQGSRKTQENRALKSRIVELEDELRAAREELESLRASLTEQFHKDVSGCHRRFTYARLLFSQHDRMTCRPKACD